jgi:cell wall-associated NlpC family hydrolase
MFAAAIGGSLLLVASPAEAIASDLDSPTPAPDSGATTVAESSPAEAPSLAQTAAAKAKAAALAKKRAADAKKPINIAKKYVGVRYKRGGTNPKSGFDCSGFTRYVYKMAGKKIPRTSSAQRHSGKTVSRAHARPGDLVWFKDFRHVAIYAGNGYIIDAPKPGKKVTKRKLWTSHVKYIRVSA